MWWIGLGVLMKNSLAADPWMAPSMAAGGVTRANPTSMGAILTSPATLALTPRYEIALGGRLGTSKVRRVEAAATDSSTGPLTLGLMYLREGASFEATPDELPGWLTPDQDTINPYTESTVGGGQSDTAKMTRARAAAKAMRYRPMAMRKRLPPILR